MSEEYRVSAKITLETDQSKKNVDSLNQSLDNLDKKVAEANKNGKINLDATINSKEIIQEFNKSIKQQSSNSGLTVMTGMLTSQINKAIGQLNTSLKFGSKDAGAVLKSNLTSSIKAAEKGVEKYQDKINDAQEANLKASKGLTSAMDAWEKINGLVADYRRKLEVLNLTKTTIEVMKTSYDEPPEDITNDEFFDKYIASNSSRKELEDLKEQAKALEEELANVQQKLSDTLGMTNTLTGTPASINALSNAVKKLYTELTEKYKYMHANSREYKEARVEVDSLKTTLEHLRAITERSFEFSYDEAGIEAYKQEIELAKQKVEELKASGIRLPNGGIQFTDGQAQELEVWQDRLRVLTEGEEKFMQAVEKATAAQKEQEEALKKTSKAAEKSHTSFGKLLKTIGRMALYRAIRSALSAVSNAITESISNVYQYSKALGSLDNTGFSSVMDKYSTALTQMKNQVGSAASSLLINLMPALIKIINWVNRAVEAISRFIAALGGRDVYLKAKEVSTEWAESTAGAIDDATESANELKRTLLGIDEINALTDNSSSGSSGSGGSSGDDTDYSEMFEEASISDEYIEKVQKIKETFEDVLTVVGAIATALLAWKIASGVSSFFNTLFSYLGKDGAAAGQMAFGITLSIIGFSIEALSAYDIGYSGANLKNVIFTAIGGALGIGGGLIAFGPASLIVTVPLALAISAISISVGKGVADVENSEAFQTAADYIEKASNSLEKIKSLAAELNDTSILDEVYEKTAMADTISSEIFNIIENDTKSEADIAKLKTLIEEFNKLELSDVQLEYNDLTGEVNATRAEVELLIEDFKKQAIAQAYTDLYAESLKTVAQLDVERKKAQDEYYSAKETYSNWETKNSKRLQELFIGVLEGSIKLGSAEYREYVQLQAEQMELQKAVDETSETYEEARQAYLEGVETSEYYYESYLGQAEKATSKWTKNTSTEAERLRKQIASEIDNTQDDFINALDVMVDEYGVDVDWIETNYPEITADTKLAKETIDKLVSLYQQDADAISYDPIEVYADTSGAYGAIRDLTNWASNQTITIATGTFTGAEARRITTGRNYASGGYPDVGSAFIAGEAGPEFVGTINGKTGVVSSNEISGIRSAVLSSGESESRLLKEQNTLLRQLLNKSSTVNVSSVMSAQNRVNRRTGQMVMA